MAILAIFEYSSEKFFQGRSKGFTTPPNLINFFNFTLVSLLNSGTVAPSCVIKSVAIVAFPPDHVINKIPFSWEVNLYND